MLRNALILVVFALLAIAVGMFPFSGMAMDPARILFCVFMVVLLNALINDRRGRAA